MYMVGEIRWGNLLLSEKGRLGFPEIASSETDFEGGLE
jgi:hypothetical protein